MTIEYLRGQCRLSERNLRRRLLDLLRVCHDESHAIEHIPSRSPLQPSPSAPDALRAREEAVLEAALEVGPAQTADVVEECGWRVLQKMGWLPGTALGRDPENPQALRTPLDAIADVGGRTNPRDKSGLGLKTVPKASAMASSSAGPALGAYS